MEAPHLQCGEKRPSPGPPPCQLLQAAPPRADTALGCGAGGPDRFSPHRSRRGLGEVWARSPWATQRLYTLPSGLALPMFNQPKVKRQSTLAALPQPCGSSHSVSRLRCPGPETQGDARPRLY